MSLKWYQIWYTATHRSKAKQVYNQQMVKVQSTRHANELLLDLLREDGITDGTGSYNEIKGYVEPRPDYSGRKIKSTPPPDTGNCESIW